MTGRWFHDTLGTPTQGTLLPQLFDVKYLDFETVLWRCAMFDLGVLALRLVLGAVFLGHGAQKAFGAFGGPGFAGATGFLGSLGFRPARVWAARSEERRVGKECRCRRAADQRNKKWRVGRGV